MALIYGQMTEPPGARLRVALSGLTVAEYFRDQGSGRAALHRQHFPLYAGRFGSVGAARPHAFGGGLSAEPRDRNGRDAGTHHFDQDRIDHFDPGGLRSGRRLHRSGAGDYVCAPRRGHRAFAPDRGAGNLSGGRSARFVVAHSRSAHRRRGALQHGAGREARFCSATKICRTSSRFSVSTNCPTKTS